MKILKNVCRIVIKSHSNFTGSLCSGSVLLKVEIGPGPPGRQPDQHSFQDQEKRPGLGGLHHLRPGLGRHPDSLPGIQTRGQRHVPSTSR